MKVYLYSFDYHATDDYSEMRNDFPRGCCGVASHIKPILEERVEFGILKDQ